MTPHGKATENDEGVLFEDYAVLWGVVDAHRTVWYPDIDFGPATNHPILFRHGGDETIRGSILGTVTERRIDDVGLWVAGQVEKSKRYYEQVKQLIDKKILGWSVAAPPGAYMTAPTQHQGVRRIIQWPLSEISLLIDPSQVRVSRPELFARSIGDFVVDSSEDEIRAAHILSRAIDAQLS